jgi:hypothetical protein
MSQGPESTPADEAEGRAIQLATTLLVVLDGVAVPSAERERWLPERLSFLLSRDNYKQCLLSLREGRDITAGTLARALFEEAVRWSWVDEDTQGRRLAFLEAAARRHRQVDEAARAHGIDPAMFYGPIVSEVLDASEDTPRFPQKIEGHLDWGIGDVGAMMYTQYRLFSQYTHSSLLASASAAEERDGQLVLGRLPQPARLTVLRNAVANIAVIVDGCQAGLVDRRPRPGAQLGFEAMGVAMAVAELVYPFAPASD